MTRRQPHIRHHDARGGLAPVLARLFDRLLQRFLDRGGKLADRVLERIGLDFEAQRQHAGRASAAASGPNTARCARGSVLPSTVTGTSRRIVPALRSVKHILAIQPGAIELNIRQSGVLGHVRSPHRCEFKSLNDRPVGRQQRLRAKLAGRHPLQRLGLEAARARR